VAHTALKGTRLWFDRGAPGGPPVLLVMGLGLRGTAWRRQVEGLGEACDLTWYDHRGVGRSDPLTGPVSMKSLASDALSLMGAIGWQDAHVIGVSMGGMVAQEIALAAPERVRSLALLATHGGGARSVLPPTGGIGLFLKTRRGPPADRARALLALLFDDAWLAGTDVRSVLAELDRDVYDPRSPESTIYAQLAAIAAHHALPRLRRLRGVPTLVIRPGRDRLVSPEGSDRLAGAIPGARLLSFPESGHAVNVQCADRVNAALLAHIDEAERARAG